MGVPETTTFGASIITKQQEDTTPPRDMATLTPAITNDSITPSYTEERLPPPCSPFYQHPPASHERVPQAYHGKSMLDIGMIEKGYLSDDMTPISTTHEKNPFCSTISVNTNKECTMWPSKQTLVAAKLDEKKRKRSARTCAFADVRHSWETLHKDHRLTVRVILAVLLIGAMVGLGVGISKAVHGSYYSASGASTST